VPGVTRSTSSDLKFADLVGDAVLRRTRARWIGWFGVAKAGGLEVRAREFLINEVPADLVSSDSEVSTVHDACAC
jgi:hypothetical protein